jgi:hypothetical protein
VDEQRVRGEHGQKCEHMRQELPHPAAPPALQALGEQHDQRNRPAHRRPRTCFAQQDLRRECHPPHEGPAERQHGSEEQPSADEQQRGAAQLRARDRRMQ